MARNIPITTKKINQIINPKTTYFPIQGTEPSPGYEYMTGYPSVPETLGKQLERQLPRVFAGKFGREHKGFLISDILLALIAIGIIGNIAFSYYVTTRSNSDKKIGKYRVYYRKNPIGNSTTVWIKDVTSGNQVYTEVLNSRDAAILYNNLDNEGQINLIVNREFVKNAPEIAQEIRQLVPEGKEVEIIEANKPKELAPVQNEPSSEESTELKKLEDEG